MHRNTIHRESRVRRITGVTIAILLLSGCIDQQTPPQEALTVSNFLGPPVGQTYIYAVDGQEILKVTATGMDSTGAVLVEERLVPSNVGEVTGSPSPMTLPAIQYKLLASGGKLVKKTAAGQTIMLQEPLVRGATKWAIRSVVARHAGGNRNQGEGRQIISQDATCGILWIGQEDFGGEKHPTIAVECVLATVPLKTMTVTKYMMNIGLFETKTEGFDQNGRSFGKQHVRLVRIE